MVEKPSRLLATAKELINNKKLNDALIICENVIQNDPSNINGLLLATKCWIDLDIKQNNIKQALEKVLELKPNNQIAIQGLRKFYEKYLECYFDDGLIFYKNLSQSNELNDKDIDIISKIVEKISLNESGMFVWDYLLDRSTKNKDISSLKILFYIAAEKFLVNHIDKIYFEKFMNVLAQFDSKNISCDDNEIDYLKSMETLFKAYFDEMEPQYFFTLLEKNDSSIYGYVLFADLICDHFMFDDCQESIEIGRTKFQSDNLFRPAAIKEALMKVEIINLVHMGNVSQLLSNWPINAIEYIPKHIWCQSYAIGFDAFKCNGIEWANVKENWCKEMLKETEILCRYIMNDYTIPNERVNDHHQVVIHSNLNSFQLYLWSRVMKTAGLLDKQRETLEHALKGKHIYYKIYADFAYVLIREHDNESAATYLLTALNTYFCPVILESLVDLRMSLEQYEEPVGIFEKLEIQQCTESLLEKFVNCLDKLGRLNDAISSSQRLVKYFPTRGQNWQLLGDLYLKRGNINSAFTTYSKSMELSGENCGIFARMGNVYSMKYQQTYNENDFTESVKFFNKSLEFSPINEAVEGKVSVHYLHAEVSLKQSMLSTAINDVQIVLELLIQHDQLIKDYEFQLNLMGKAIFLSILGNIDKLINFQSTVQFLTLSNKSVIDTYEIGEKCFKLSVGKFPNLSESYLNHAMLCLLKLNKSCTSNQRGNDAYSDLYKQAEDLFKTTLHFDSQNAEAWKYLGYLYLRHGIITHRHVFDVQHCLSMSLNLSSTVDSLKDPESAFLLGLLYIRENWCSLAKELFQKIQMDQHVNPIGYIGMYLLGGKDHSVSEQMEISRAIMCYTYRDEDSNLDDCCHRMNDSVVGLFCDNLGFLISSQCDYESFDSQETRPDLITALKTTLNIAWTKYESYNSIGVVMPPNQQKQYKEYGSFLGMLELLTGNYQSGKQLINKTSIDLEENNLEKLFDLLKLESSWIDFLENNGEAQQCIKYIERVAENEGLSIYKDEILESSIKDSTRNIDEIMLTAITQHLSSSPSLHKTLEIFISKLPVIYGKIGLTQGLQTSFLSVATMIFLNRNHSLAEMLIEIIHEYIPNLDDTIVGFSRVLARLKALVSSPKDAYKYLLNHSLKQPYEMDRWMNLLEFGLENHDQLLEFTSISDIFHLTNRPWCFTTFDVERYALILKRNLPILTRAALSQHRHMIMHSMKLFPHLCSEIFTRFFFNQ